MVPCASRIASGSLTHTSIRPAGSAGNGATSEASEASSSSSSSMPSGSMVGELGSMMRREMYRVAEAAPPVGAVVESSASATVSSSVSALSSRLASNSCPIGSPSSSLPASAVLSTSWNSYGLWLRFGRRPVGIC
eukprot:7391485-Prymnesium_polylepis.5